MTRSSRLEAALAGDGDRSAAVVSEQTLCVQGSRVAPQSRASSSLYCHCIRGSRLAQSRLPRMRLDSEMIHDSMDCALVATPKSQSRLSGDGRGLMKQQVGIASVAAADANNVETRSFFGSPAGQRIWFQSQPKSARVMYPCPCPCSVLSPTSCMCELQISPFGQVVPGLMMLIV